MISIDILLQYFLPPAMIVYLSACAASTVAITQLIKTIVNSIAKQLGINFRVQGIYSVIISFVVSCLVVFATAISLQQEIAITKLQVAIAIIAVFGIANGFWQVAKSK